MYIYMYLRSYNHIINKMPILLKPLLLSYCHSWYKWVHRIVRTATLSILPLSLTYNSITYSLWNVTESSSCAHMPKWMTTHKKPFPFFNSLFVVCDLWYTVWFGATLIQTTDFQTILRFCHLEAHHSRRKRNTEGGEVSRHDFKDEQTYHYAHQMQLFGEVNHIMHYLSVAILAVFVLEVRR